MTDTTVWESIEFTDTRPGYENRDGSFVIVPKKMSQDPNLSDAEYRVLSYLHDKAGNPNPELYSAKNREWCRIAFTSMETIGKETNRSKRQAQETITSLELKGYVKIVHRKTNKGINNVYTIQFPSSYQALNKVNTFTQVVATGKKAAKRGSAENLLTPSAENRTTSSEENRTVNSSIEIAPYETGTSTELRSEGNQETENNQGQPLVETNETPGSSPGEVDKELEVIGKGLPLVDVVDAPASPTPIPGEAMGSDQFRTSYLKKLEQRSKAIADKNKVRRFQSHYESPLAMERRVIHEELRREFQ